MVFQLGPSWASMHGVISVRGSAGGSALCWRSAALREQTPLSIMCMRSAEYSKVICLNTLHWQQYDQIPTAS